MIRDAIVGGLALICFAVGASLLVAQLPRMVLEHDHGALEEALH